MNRSEPAAACNLQTLTRYTPVNIIFLVLGVGVSTFDYFYAGFILKSVGIGEKGGVSVGADFLPALARIAIVATLIAIRWPKTAAVVLWIATAFYFAISVGLHIFPDMLVPAVLLAVAAALASFVAYFSSKPPSADATAAE